MEPRPVEQIVIPQIKPEETKKKKWPYVILAVVAVFLLINITLAFNVYSKEQKLMASAKKVKAALSSKDFKQFKTSVVDTKTALISFKKAYALITWTRIIPVIGTYVGDGSKVLNAAQTGFEMSDSIFSVIEPYADLIGFTAGGEADGQKTASDRIDFLVKTLPDIMPKLDGIITGMKKIDGQLSGINPNTYPVKFAGKPVRAQVESALNTYKEVSSFIQNGKPLIEQTPYLLGLDSPRTYLVIFQNDKELRPTGGFITAYSVMKVDKAKFEPVSSNDIYNLDSLYKPSIPAPDPIVNYIRGPYVLSKNLRLRDMNWSPDFAVSMKQFVTEVDKVGIRNIDGVIGVDTQLLVNLLKVIGPIGVSGFGNFSNEIVPACNCPQVIYELESFADVEGPVVWDPAGTGKIIYAPANMDNRKKIIGPLMNSILSNAFAQPKAKLPGLFEAGYNSLMQKHVLFYLLDQGKQTAAEQFGISGKIMNFTGDYLSINDANLGGRKSNLYITQEVDQQIKVGKDGMVEKTVTISYKNPEKQDGWLNSVLPDWVRIYVPKGSQLLSLDGVQARVDPYEDLGKTVFAGYYELRPQGVVTITVKYRLPFKVKAGSNYNLLIQKQAGTDKPRYSIEIGKKQEEFLLETDKQLLYKL